MCEQRFFHIAPTKPALFAFLAAVAMGPGLLFASDLPNFLMIMADDCTFNDLPVYGGGNAFTPNIDRLASQGLTFNRAYLSEAMCPGRVGLNCTAANTRCAMVAPGTTRPVDRRPPACRITCRPSAIGLVWLARCMSSPATPFRLRRWTDSIPVASAIRRGRTTWNPSVTSWRGTPDSPFCLVVALVEPHVPWVMGDATRYPPNKLELPPHIADTLRTRRDFSKYLAEITYMDEQVGEILTTLDQVGQPKNTLVLFTSEQGAQFPGCKWTNWDTGLHTALIARWPGRVAAGQRTGRFGSIRRRVTNTHQCCRWQSFRAQLRRNEFSAGAVWTVFEAPPLCLRSSQQHPRGARPTRFAPFATEGTATSETSRRTKSTSKNT